MLAEKIHPSRLGFDFDGVIADTAEAFLRIACEKYNLCDVRLDDITRFDVEECLSIEPEIIRSVFNEILHDSVGNGLRPMPGATEVIGELAEMAPLTLITARSHPEPVEQWLRREFSPSVSKRINLVAMGDHDDKGRYIKSHKLDFFIDDRLKTCLQLSAAGIQPIVFTQPWNSGRHNLPSVGCWEEIRSLCL